MVASACDQLIMTAGIPFTRAQKVENILDPGENPFFLTNYIILCAVLHVSAHVDGSR